MKGCGLMDAWVRSDIIGPSPSPRPSHGKQEPQTSHACSQINIASSVATLEPTANGVY